MNGQLTKDHATLGEAARALGVSLDTLRRWDRSGKLRTTRDERNWRLVPVSEIDRISRRPERRDTLHALAARNRFAGLVRSIEVDGVMAVVVIEAGPFLVTAALTRHEVEELRLVKGLPATATVPPTAVRVQTGELA